MLSQKWPFQQMAISLFKGVDIKSACWHCHAANNVRCPLSAHLLHNVCRAPSSLNAIFSYIQKMVVPMCAQNKLVFSADIGVFPNV
ncbi:MAG: hypothetical protein V3V09_04580 [Arenicellales bacterium]